MHRHSSREESKSAGPQLKQASCDTSFSAAALQRFAADLLQAGLSPDPSLLQIAAASIAAADDKSGDDPDPSWTSPAAAAAVEKFRHELAAAKAALHTAHDSATANSSSSRPNLKGLSTTGPHAEGVCTAAAAAGLSSSTFRLAAAQQNASPANITFQQQLQQQLSIDVIASPANPITGCALSNSSSSPTSPGRSAATAAVQSFAARMADLGLSPQHSLSNYACSRTLLPSTPVNTKPQQQQQQQQQEIESRTADPDLIRAASAAAIQNFAAALAAAGLADPTVLQLPGAAIEVLTQPPDTLMSHRSADLAGSLLSQQSSRCAGLAAALLSQHSSADLATPLSQQSSRCAELAAVLLSRHSSTGAAVAGKQLHQTGSTTGQVTNQKPPEDLLKTPSGTAQAQISAFTTAAGFSAAAAAAAAEASSRPTIPIVGSRVSGKSVAAGAADVAGSSSSAMQPNTHLFQKSGIVTDAASVFQSAAATAADSSTDGAAADMLARKPASRVGSPTASSRSQISQDHNSPAASKSASKFARVISSSSSNNNSSSAISGIRLSTLSAEKSILTSPTAVATAAGSSTSGSQAADSSGIQVTRGANDQRTPAAAAAAAEGTATSSSSKKSAIRPPQILADSSSSSSSDDGNSSRSPEAAVVAMAATAAAEREITSPWGTYKWRHTSSAASGSTLDSNSSSSGSKPSSTSHSRSNSDDSNATAADRVAVDSVNYRAATAATSSSMSSSSKSSSSTNNRSNEVGERDLAESASAAVAAVLGQSRSGRCTVIPNPISSRSSSGSGSTVSAGTTSSSSSSQADTSGWMTAACTDYSACADTITTRFSPLYDAPSAATAGELHSGRSCPSETDGTSYGCPSSSSSSSGSSSAAGDNCHANDATYTTHPGDLDDDLISEQQLDIAAACIGSSSSSSNQMFSDPVCEVDLNDSVIMMHRLSTIPEYDSQSESVLLCTLSTAAAAARPGSSSSDNGSVQHLLQTDRSLYSFVSDNSLNSCYTAAAAAAAVAAVEPDRQQQQQLVLSRAGTSETAIHEINFYSFPEDYLHRSSTDDTDFSMMQNHADSSANTTAEQQQQQQQQQQRQQVIWHPDQRHTTTHEWLLGRSTGGSAELRHSAYTQDNAAAAAAAVGPAVQRQRQQQSEIEVAMPCIGVVKPAAAVAAAMATPAAAAGPRSAAFGGCLGCVRKQPTLPQHEQQQQSPLPAQQQQQQLSDLEEAPSCDMAVDKGAAVAAGPELAAFGWCFSCIREKPTLQQQHEQPQQQQQQQQQSPLPPQQQQHHKHGASGSSTTTSQSYPLSAATSGVSLNLRPQVTTPDSSSSSSSSKSDSHMHKSNTCGLAVKIPKNAVASNSSTTLHSKEYQSYVSVLLHRDDEPVRFGRYTKIRHVLLPLLLLLAAAGLGVGLGVGLWQRQQQQHRQQHAVLSPLVTSAEVAVNVTAGHVAAAAAAAAAAVAAGEMISFRVVMAVVTANDSNTDCNTWFGSDQDIERYKYLFTSAYAAALGVNIPQDAVTRVTCGSNTTVVESVEIMGSSSSSSSSGGPASTYFPPAGRLLLQYPAASSSSSSSSSSGGLIQVVTDAVISAPTLLSQRESVMRSIQQDSSSILASSMEDFFRRRVLWPEWPSVTVATASSDAAAAAAAAGEPNPIMLQPDVTATAAAGFPRDGNASDGQRLHFQIAVSVPAMDKQRGCQGWFGSQKRVEQYKQLIATAFSTALGAQIPYSVVTSITCGGWPVLEPTAEDPQAPKRRLLTVRPPQRGLMQNPGSSKSAPNAASQLQQPAAESFWYWQAANDPGGPPTVSTKALTMVEVITQFYIPAPGEEAERERTIDIATSQLAGVLDGPFSGFFSVPAASLEYAPWGKFKPDDVDYDLMPTCLFPPTKSNSVADSQGRLWSIMDGRACVFRPLVAPKAPNDAVGHQVLWKTAPACSVVPNDSNSVADDRGRLWGWENNASCAFKETNKRSKGIERMPASKPPSGVSAVMWDAAPVCKQALGEDNSVPDTKGRLWGWENGTSCAFRAQVPSYPA